MNREAFTNLIQKRSSFLSAIALLSLSVIIAVIAFYQGYNRNISRQKAIELTAVTNLKADDISIWYNYRMKDATDLSRNEIFKAKLESYLLKKNERTFKNLYSFLDSFRIEKEYFEICIASGEGELLFTTDSLSEGLDKELKRYIILSADSMKALSDDLYLCKTHNKKHIDFISPVSIRKGSAPLIIVLRVDPEKSLFPLVKSWPSESNITKNILLRVKGDSLMLLSSPINNNGFQVKPVRSLNLPNDASITDYKGITKLINPNNKKELAYVRSIKGTSWHLVSMLSKQNTFSQVGNTRLIFSLTILSLLLFIIGVVLIYLIYQRKSYMMILREINERKAADMRQKALYRIAESMLISPTVSELSNVIIDQIESVIQCQDIRIELYGRPIKNIPSLSFEGTKYASQLEKPVDGSLQSYCLKQGKPLILNSKELESLIKEGQIKQDNEIMTSCLVLPLFSKTVPMATLSISGKEENAFDESLITFLEIIVNQTRTFIDRKVNEDEVIKLSKGIIQSPVSILITDRDSNIEYVNPKYLQVTGLKSEDIIGKHYSEVRKNFMPADTFEDMVSRLSDNKDWTGELLSTAQNGEQIWESIHVSPILDNKGNISHYISIRDDITEEKNMIDKLIIAKEKAEESDRLKTSFLANMSHEVRTPMNAIIGFAELLSFRDISKDEQLEYSQVIKQRSYELLAIIDDIIDVSRLETGKLKMFKEKVNICDILADAYNTATTVWRESGKSSVNLELINEVPDSEIYAYTDSGRLRQILTNLIDNAFKFTEEGVIKFGCMNSNERDILFYVRDTGIGIPEDKQSVIFERFRQVEEDYSRKKGGIGLGLSICKGLAELLDGNIWVKSEPGKGSTFFFTISKGTGEPEDKETKKVKKMINSNIKGIWVNRRLLVVEDEPLNARYIQNALEPSGINLVHADTGTKAIEVLKKDQLFDAVLLDIRLPDIDGFELARQMKSINSSIRIIAQTAYASDQYMKMCFDAGCDDYLAKPFKVQDLFEVLRKYL